MEVLATGHQVCCKLWVQAAVFNKVIDFSCGLIFFVLDIICEEYLQPSLCLILQIC